MLLARVALARLQAITTHLEWNAAAQHARPLAELQLAAWRVVDAAVPS